MVNQLLYKKIKSREQYDEYCRILDLLLDEDSDSAEITDQIELLTLLIDTYQNETSTLKTVSPIELVKYLMEENKLSQIKLASILDISAGHLSDILSEKKALSKEIIGKLSLYFKVSQESFLPKPVINIKFKKR
jgi:HTH-type transcriptional regulator/antitoxin HigA